MFTDVLINEPSLHFSSPHLFEVRERIRINGRPLSQETFTHYFWECWTKFTVYAYVDFHVFKESFDYSFFLFFRLRKNIILDSLHLWHFMFFYKRK